ncbi:hypothetical protein [Prochlorococcus sp. MIT 1307]|uniref:hypothetical protein n=1 Tax=Prochlorococcus sp. MIT 1307 TaxID=3096219 RepID=UPI002A74A400|nr:hypothetical protein [Prochlorococcus sp. MIT 1307]
MEKEDLPDSFKKTNPPSKGLREVLESLRNIFVAAIAAVISIAEWLSRRLADWQSKSEMQAKIAETRRLEAQAKIDQERRSEERAIREEKRNAEEQAKINQERRSEERAIREEERKLKEQNLPIKKIVYPALSAMSTFALIVGVAMLAPIAKWTRSQNECIQQTSLNANANEKDLANKVMRCNGGHD